MAAVDGYLIEAKAEDDMNQQIYGKPGKEHLKDTVFVTATDTSHEKQKDDGFHYIVDP